MAETSNGKPSNKALALAALNDAIEESKRVGGPRTLVLEALLVSARAVLQQVQELVRQRKPKGPAGRIGPFETKAEADAAADALRKAGL